MEARRVQSTQLQLNEFEIFDLLRNKISSSHFQFHSATFLRIDRQFTRWELGFHCFNIRFHFHFETYF